MTPLEEIIQKEVRRHLSLVTIVGKVSAVDTDNRTCDIEFEDDLTAPILGCRLNSVVNDHKDNVLIIPRIGSYVLVTGVEGNIDDKYVVGYSEIDKMSIKIGDTSADIDKDGIIFNGGENKGAVKIKELTDKLNELKNSFNSLVSTFNSHIHTTTATISASPTVGVISPTTSQAQQTQAFKVSDYENDKIKH